MNTIALDYLAFELAVAAIFIEVLAKDGHCDYEFGRRRSDNRVQWSLTRPRGDAPYEGLSLSEVDRDAELTLVLLDGKPVSERVRGRRPPEIRAAIDRLRATAGLMPL